MDGITFELTLAVHNALRWVVLLLMLYGLVRAIAGAVTDAKRTSSAKLVGILTIVALDVQILLGLLLHLVLSPTTKSAMQDMGAAMKDPEQRFWVVEHGAMMVLAAVFVHGCRIWAKRARSDRSEDFRTAVGLGLGLAAVAVVGSGIASAWAWVGVRLGRIFDSKANTQGG